MIIYMTRIARIAAMILCSLGAIAMSACMTVPASEQLLDPAAFRSALESPPTSFSSTSGYSSNGSSSSSYSSASAAAAPAPSGYGASDSADGGTVPPGYTNDTAQSGTLTSYLQSHRLPLVGAQVLTDSSGNQQIILYGFVATDFGKQDAADKARRYLHNPNAPVINRIAVRPELASAAPARSTAGASGAYGSTGSSGSSGDGLGSVQSYQDQAQQAQQQQQYMQNSQPSPSALTTIIPLIGMMGLLSMGSGSFGMWRRRLSSQLRFAVRRVRHTADRRYSPYGRCRIALLRRLALQPLRGDALRAVLRLPRSLSLIERAAASGSYRICSRS